MTTVDHFRIQAGAVTASPPEQPLGMSARRARVYLLLMTAGASGIGILGAFRVGVL